MMWVLSKETHRSQPSPISDNSSDPSREKKASANRINIKKFPFLNYHNAHTVKYIYEHEGEMLLHS